MITMIILLCYNTVQYTSSLFDFKFSFFCSFFIKKLLLNHLIPPNISVCIHSITYIKKEYVQSCLQLSLT